MERFIFSGPASAAFFYAVRSPKVKAIGFEGDSLVIHADVEDDIFDDHFDRLPGIYPVVPPVFFKVEERTDVIISTPKPRAKAKKKASRKKR